MSGIYPNPLNPLSKVYLEQIATNEGYDKPDEKLKTDRNMFNIPKDEQKAAKERLLAKAKAKRAAAMEALDPVGKEDGDVNNDGKKDSTDSYLLKRRKAIAKAMKTRKEELEMQEGIRDEDPEKGTAERKARLEKKRGMKMDDHPQYKKEEVEVDEAVKGQDTEMRKAASAERKSGDKRLSPSAGKGYADQQKQSISYMDKKTKNNKIVVGMTHEALDPVGKEDGDVNNDGKKDSTDSYLMKRRKAIGNAMKKKMKEHRELAEESLTEVMTDEMDDKPIKEKKVKNKITINPKLGEAVEEMGGTLIEEIEVDEFDVIVETVYEELIEEGFSEDEVEHGIETALNTLDEGYYDSAVAASKAAAAKNKGETPKKSMKDRLKSAAKRAIMGVSKAAGKAVRAKAAVQAAPGKAKAKVTSMADRVKRIAKAGYASGRGPVEKKSKTTSYRGAGVGRKEKIGEESVVENVATGKAKRAKRGGIAQKVGASEVVSNKEKDAAYAKKKASDMASDAAAGDAAHKAATDKGMSPAEAMMRKKAAERKAARERARMMK